jgi:hypothetical protein
VTARSYAHFAALAVPASPSIAPTSTAKPTHSTAPVPAPTRRPTKAPSAVPTLQPTQQAGLDCTRHCDVIATRTEVDANKLINTMLLPKYFSLSLELQSLTAAPISTLRNNIFEIVDQDAVHLLSMYTTESLHVDLWYDGNLIASQLDMFGSGPARDLAVHTVLIDVTPGAISVSSLTTGLSVQWAASTADTYGKAYQFYASNLQAQSSLGNIRAATVQGTCFHAVPPFSFVVVTVLVRCYLDSAAWSSVCGAHLRGRRDRFLRAKLRATDRRRDSHRHGPRTGLHLLAAAVLHAVLRRLQPSPGHGVRRAEPPAPLGL